MIEVAVLAAGFAKYDGGMPDDERVAIRELVPRDPLASDPRSVLRLQILGEPCRTEPRHADVLARHTEIDERELEDPRAIGGASIRRAGRAAHDVDTIDPGEAAPRAGRRWRVTGEPR